ncbi:MAG: US12 family protein [Anaerolineales bacterium]|nr:US12 family protein [Anaerolineales bacterium]MCB9126434.1 US12 family protein [Ardenticatenales bacterium]MCB9171593.1 US12 family protein [Ardenticatenales bacterium]
MTVQELNRRYIPAGQLDAESRGAFLAKTYLTLFGAIVAFTVLETVLFVSGLGYELAARLISVNWLLVLGIFMVLSWMARRVAAGQSLAGQYAGLGLYILAYSVIFTPMLAVASLSSPSVLMSAAVVTLVGFAALTAIVFVTRKDFSALRGFLAFGGILALILIVLSVFTGIELGPIFSVGMIALAGASILHDTSRILNDYPADRYVSAALELFASVALLFWYVLRLFMRR